MASSGKSDPADRQAGQVAHLAVGASAHGVADALAQRVHVELVAALEALLAQPALDRLLLHRAEEEAVEDQVEDAPVLLRLGDRGRQRLAEVLLLRPRHVSQSLERVEQLARPDLHPLAAQLVGELEQSRGEPRRPRRGDAAEDRLAAGTRPASRRLRPARGRHSTA